MSSACSMTYEERVVKALKILGTEADRATVEKAVEDAMADEIRRLRLLDDIDPSARRLYFQPKNKAEKLAADQLRSALQKVQTLLKREDLKKIFPKKPDLTQWLEELDEMKRVADFFARRPLGKPKPSKLQKRRAARIAAAVLERSRHFRRLQSHGRRSSGQEERCRDPRLGA